MARFYIVLLVFIFFLSSCNNDSPSDCGCNSESWTTVTDVEGTLSYKIQTGPMDDFYNNKFVLGVTFSDCENCSQGFIVCNEKMLKEYKYLIREEGINGEMVPVKFSGSVHEVCQGYAAPAGRSFNRIVLTSIAKQ